MTSQLKSAESKQIREDFVPSFDSKTFDLQVPQVKLDHTMSRGEGKVFRGASVQTSGCFSSSSVSLKRRYIGRQSEKHPDGGSSCFRAPVVGSCLPQRDNQTQRKYS